jgi:hypothetical protein
MKRTIVALLGIILSCHTAVAGKYTIDEGDSGDPEAYLEAGPKQNLVVYACVVKEGKYDFEIAVPIDNPAPGSMLETMQRDAGVSIKGSVCMGAFCRQMTFGLSDYFSGPATGVAFDRNQVSSATSLEVELPGGVNLKWEGQVRDVLRKTCR